LWAEAQDRGRWRDLLEEANTADNDDYGDDIQQRVFVKFLVRQKAQKYLDQLSDYQFNPLNSELYPICHLLVLLGDLTFMGPCIVSIF
jgi:hypothetical protein